MDGHVSRGYGQNSIGLGEKAAILVVDYQALLTDPASPMWGGEQVSGALSATARLLKVARELGLRVFYTTVGYAADGRDMALWPLKIKHLPMCVRGSRWTEIPDVIAPLDTELVFPKRMASAFFGTDLLTFLVMDRIDSLVVCGATTGGCLRATVVDGFQYGFRVVVPRECTIDMDPAAYDVNLQDIEKRYGDVVSLDALLEDLKRKFAQ
jgi:maleamate amidohydrolase